MLDMLGLFFQDIERESGFAAGHGRGEMICKCKCKGSPSVESNRLDWLLVAP